MPCPSSPGREAAEVGCGHADSRFREMIATGQQAPDFTLPDQDGEDVMLSSLRGRPAVLYFYPKADTPGCTTQACGIRDHSTDYDAAGAVVLGVSPDPVTAVKNFHATQSLNFT